MPNFEEEYINNNSLEIALAVRQIDLQIRTIGSTNPQAIQEAEYLFSEGTIFLALVLEGSLPQYTISVKPYDDYLEEEILMHLVWLARRATLKVSILNNPVGDGWLVQFHRFK